MRLEGRKPQYQLSPIDPDDAAFFDRECQPAVLQRNRSFAEQFAAPAVQRGDIGVVVGGDLVEIVDGGDHFAGDGVTFRRHPQQHLQEFNGRGPVRITARLYVNYDAKLRAAMQSHQGTLGLELKW